MPAEYKDRSYTNSLAAHLFATTRHYEPQRTNNFELQIVGLDHLVAAGADTSRSSSGNNSFIGYTDREIEVLQAVIPSGELTLSIQGAFTPQENMSKLEVPYGNSSVKFAGKVDYPDGTLTWTDYYQQDMELVLKCWYKTVYNGINGAVGDAVDYKREAYLTSYSPSGKYARRWKLYGAFPTQINGDDYSNENNSIRRLSCTLSYDRAVRLDTLDSESGSNINAVNWNV